MHVLAAQLLAAAREQRPRHLGVRPQALQGGHDHRRIVLAVDDHDGARQVSYRRSSWGAGQMYFSNDADEGTNSMSVSVPWKGNLRTTCTLSPSTVMML